MVAVLVMVGPRRAVAFIRTRACGDRGLRLPCGANRAECHNCEPWMLPPPPIFPLLVAGSRLRARLRFRLVANRVNFCTMGAVADIVNFGDWRRMRMWLLAIAVAILAPRCCTLTGMVDLSKSIYTGGQVAWLSPIVGGFLFGVRMTLASGCGSKTLIRAGAGNLKSLVVLVMLGIAGYMTLRGAVRGLAHDGARPVAARYPAVGAATSDLPAIVTARGRRRRGQALAAARLRRWCWRSSCSRAAISVRRLN